MTGGLATADIGIYIDPPSHHFARDRLFDSAAAGAVGDNLMAPWIAVRDHFAARGVPVHTADLMPPKPATGARALYVAVNTLDNYRRFARRKNVTLSAYFAMESPVVEPRQYRRLPRAASYFRRVLSWSDPASLLPFTKSRVNLQRSMVPQSYDGVHDRIWANNDRQFLVMINSNKLPRMDRNELYSARLRAVEFFHRYGEIDLYGLNWDRMPNRVGASVLPPAFWRAYRVAWEVKQRLWPNPLYLAASQITKGRPAAKAETLGRYTFALCFENMILEGYITEKIFDCFFAGTIPVYWGAPDILDWVPAECFIDMRKFADFEELRRFLHHLDASQIDAYRNAARAYLESPRFDPFRTSTFVNLFRRIMREDASLDL